MTDFSNLFKQSKGQPIFYKDRKIIMQDKIVVENNDVYKVTFEKVNSEWKQGISLKLDGFINLNNQSINHINLWEDTSPKSVSFHIKVKNKKELKIYNIWDTGNGVTMNWYWGSAMYFENIKNGKRYFCNDGHPDENFDKLVFTIEKIVVSQ